MKPLRYLIALSVGLMITNVPSRAQEKRLPTLFIIGDSTVKNSGKGLLGWGDPIANFFDQTRIHIENRARGGRSSRTFVTEGLWDQVVAQLQPGDFVLMQFGHNDGGAVNDDSRARGSLRGIGDETEEIDNLLTKKHEVVHTFGWYMKKFVTDTRAKGATPIMLSFIPRNVWKDGKVVRGSESYGKWAAQVAAAEQVAFIDLNEIVAKKYEALGPDKVKELYFLEDHTHTTPAGAEVNAASVVEGLRALKNCPLAAFLLKKTSGSGPVMSVSPRGRDRVKTPGFSAPKARNVIAQGNALGNAPLISGSAEGAKYQWSATHFAPSALSRLQLVLPGALPQAFTFRALGAPDLEFSHSKS